jgi:hypothetical protein
MLAHLTAISIVSFSLWGIVFVGLPVFFHLREKDKLGPFGRPSPQAPRWDSAASNPDRRKRSSRMAA